MDDWTYQQGSARPYAPKEYLGVERRSEISVNVEICNGFSELIKALLNDVRYFYFPLKKY